MLLIKSILSHNYNLVATNSARIVQERQSPKRRETEILILVLGCNYLLLAKLLDVSFDIRHNFDPSIFVFDLEVTNELLSDEAALLLSEVVCHHE